MLTFYFQNESEESVPPSACQVGTKITIKDSGENFPPLVLILHTGVTEALPPGLTILVTILVILTLEHRDFHI